jgi:hypothetical protein
LEFILIKLLREKKCHGMNMVRRIGVYHEDVAVANMHSLVIALLQEVVFWVNLKEI